MIRAAVLLVLWMATLGGAYWSGMRHYDLEQKDAALGAMAKSLLATDKARASHKAAAHKINDILRAERTAWGIYENDTPDRCARTAINDPRLVRVLLGLPEGHTDPLRVAAGGVPQADPDTLPVITWGEAGGHIIELRAAPSSCNADKAAIVEWCEANDCLRPEDVVD